MSYIPITIQAQDPDTEEWTDLLHLHARQANRSGGGEGFAAGAGQYHPRLTFSLRWCPALEALRYATATHRIVYGGRVWNIVDYDDYMERHREVRLVGEAYV